MNTKIILYFKNLLISIFKNKKWYFFKKSIYCGSCSDLLEGRDIISRIETDKGVIISENYDEPLSENHYFLPPYLIQCLLDKQVLDNLYSGEIPDLTSYEIASIRAAYKLLMESKELKEPNDDSEFSSRLIKIYNLKTA